MHYHPRRSASSKRHVSLILPLLLGSLSHAAHAQFTNTWTGTGANSNWSTPRNWKNLVPVSAATTTLDFTGTAATSNNDLSASGQTYFQLNLMQFDVTAALTLSGNQLDFVSDGTRPALTQKSASSIIIDNAIALSSDFTVNLLAAGKVTLAGVISGAGGLTITGTQPTYTTILSNSANSYLGNTTITGGTLQLGANNALASGTELYVTGTTTDAALDMNGKSATVGDIFFGNGTTLSTNAISITDSSVGQKGTLTLNGNITYNPGTDSLGNSLTPTAYINTNMMLASGQHVIDNSGNTYYASEYYDMVITGQIKGSGGLDIGSVNDVYTAMNIALGHANTYTGTTNIYNGYLYLGATNALPLNGAVTVGYSGGSSGGSLYLYVPSDQKDYAGLLTSGSYSQSIGSLADNGLGYGVVYLGAATLTVGSNNASTTFSGSIEDNDGLSSDTTLVGGSLVKVGTGTLTLGGENSYTGSTTIEGGTLQLGINDALPDLFNTTDNTDLTLTGGTFDMNGYRQTVNTLTNAGTVLVSSASKLTVAGAYTQSAGTTQVNGTLALTPGQDLTLTGGNLVGTGTIGNSTTSGTITVTNSGGTVRPGDLLPSVTVGTLTINGNYAQASSGTLEIDLAGTNNNDLLKVTNNANLAGTLNIKLLNGFVPTVGETFNFLDYGTISNNFASIVGLDPGYTYTDSFVSGIGTLTVVAAGVPETSTLFAATLMLGTGGLLLRQQRRLHRKETTPAA
jgi:fibronectin-binding autotransporter adhesin